MPNQSKDLAPIEDLKTVHRYLRYAIELHEIVSCYIEDASVRFDCYTLTFDAQALTIELEINPDEFARLGAEELAAIDRRESSYRLSYTVNEVTFFVHAKLQHRSAKKLVLKASMPMYKLQRREALRIKVLDTHGASIVIAGESYRIHDISAGGLSILVGMEQQTHFQKQQPFPKSKLHFVGKEFEVNLETKSIQSSAKDGLTWKIGFHFKQLPAAVEHLIAREAYLHTHKIWARWL